LRILSNAWALLVLIAIAFCAPAKGNADEAELRAEIARLTQENAELRAQLYTCSSNAGVDQSDVLTLLRKLGQQQSGAASFALGFGGGPLIIPEALCRALERGGSQQIACARGCVGGGAERTCVLDGSYGQACADAWFAA